METPKDKTPSQMTTAEIEAAIREHREHTRRLLEEIRIRREADAELRKKALEFLQRKK